jgi:hypothetical protein
MGLDVNQIVGLLQDQQAHKIDLVAPVGALSFLGGNLVIDGRAPELTEDGFYDVNGLYRPIGGVDSQVSTVFDIPKKYMDKLRAEDVSLLDHNLNELIKMVAAKRPEQKHLVRLLWGEDENFPGSSGIVRALLSDRYAIYDNLDTLLAVLDGLRGAGLGIEHIKSIDLSDNRLYLSVRAPEISAMAPELLKGYRSPWANTTHGIPLRACPAWDQPGLGYHAMWGFKDNRNLTGVLDNPWTPSKGKTCPGKVRIAQFWDYLLPSLNCSTVTVFPGASRVRVV